MEYHIFKSHLTRVSVACHGMICPPPKFSRFHQAAKNEMFILNIEQGHIA